MALNSHSPIDPWFLFNWTIIDVTKSFIWSLVIKGFQKCILWTMSTLIHHATISQNSSRAKIEQMPIVPIKSIVSTVSTASVKLSFHLCNLSIKCVIISLWGNRYTHPPLPPKPCPLQTPISSHSNHPSHPYQPYFHIFHLPPYTMTSWMPWTHHSWFYFEKNGISLNSLTTI